MLTSEAAAAVVVVAVTAKYSTPGELGIESRHLRPSSSLAGAAAKTNYGE